MDQMTQCLDLGSIPLVITSKININQKYKLSMGFRKECNLFQIQKILTLNYYLEIIHIYHLIKIKFKTYRNVFKKYVN